MQPVPHLIHQTWKQNVLGNPLKTCVDSFRKWNPDWDWCFYNDAECETFIRAELPDFVPTYLNYPPGILRADIFRIVVLYVRGGVYADIDMECLRPLKDLLEHLGQGDWEVLLGRDHPCHERTHYEGRTMWLNAFMIAKPRSQFFGLVLDAFTRQLEAGYNTEDAVQATGPGFLTKIIELADGEISVLKIKEMPWQWVHPLPNVFVRFEERPQYKRLIRTRQWREGRQIKLLEDTDEFEPWGEPPFVAHYWWHSYIENCRKVNMLLKYQNSLLQTDGEIVERRLAQVAECDCPQSLGEALCQLAERQGKTIFLSGEPLPAEILKTIADAGFGLDWRISATESEKESDLIIHHSAENNPLSCGWGLSRRGLLLILNRGGDERRRDELSSSALRAISDFSLWEKIPSPAAEIVRVFHVFEGLKGNRWQAAAQTSWRSCCKPLKVENWTVNRISKLISDKEPDFLPTFLEYPTDEHRLLAGRWVVLKHCGGIVASPNAICLQSLEKDIHWNRLLMTNEGSSLGGYQVTDEWIASSLSHPFWNGVCSQLENSRYRPLEEAVGSHFINERCKTAASFLDQKDWPKLLDQRHFGACPQGEQWLRLVDRQNWHALRMLVPQVSVLSMKRILGPISLAKNV